MKTDIEQYCQKCHLCASRKPHKPTRSPLGSNHVSAPLERVAIDICGPFPLSNSGNKYILVICDCFTRWTEAIPIPNQEADTIVKAFVDVYVSRFGVPLQIHSDQGRNFTSKLFAEMCQLLQIHHTQSTAFHPQSNGIVERFNRTLSAMLAMYCSEKQRTWDQFLPQVMLAYRSSVNASTGKTPNQMVFGRDVILPMQACMGLPPQYNSLSPDTVSSPTSYVTQLHQQIEVIHQQAQKNLKMKTQYRKRHYDLTAKSRTFSIGEAVWVHAPSRQLGKCSKLSPRWKGHCLITKKIDDLVYMVRMSP